MVQSEEYKQLYETTWAHVKAGYVQYRWLAEQRQDYVLFQDRTVAREVKNLQRRNVTIVEDDHSGDRTPPRAVCQWGVQNRRRRVVHDQLIKPVELVVGVARCKAITRQSARSLF